MAKTICINNPTDNPLGHSIGKTLVEHGMKLVSLETRSDIIIDFSVDYSDTIIVMDYAFFRSSPTIIVFPDFPEEEKKQIEDYGYETPVFMTDGRGASILAAVDFFKEARKPRVYTMADIKV